MTAEVTGGAVGAAVLAAVRAGPASVADSYKDKRVKIIVGWPAGRWGDRYARAPGRRIFRHIPFRPPLPRSDA